jgi:hypothetical protein
MKPHCCEHDCDQDAEFGIYPVPQADPCDTTETCSSHIGDLLGTTGTHEPTHYLIYPL